MGYPSHYPHLDHPQTLALGHGIPAAFYFGFGSFFLALALKRCRDLELCNNADRRCLTYADVHTSENPLVLSCVAWILMICTTIGFFVEGLGGFFFGCGFFSHNHLVHQVMYLSYLFVALVCLFEAKKKLFPNAHRYAIAFTFLMQYVMWNEHAMMKTDMIDMRVHLLQAYVNFAAFVTIGYLAYSPKSLFAYITGYALMVFNGMWLLTAGLSHGCISLTMLNVAPVFILEALSIATAIVICIVCFLESPLYDERKEEKEGNAKYSTLSVGESAPYSLGNMNSC